MEVARINQADRKEALDALSERGMAIYETQLKSQLEPLYTGEIVAVEPDSGEYEVASDSYAAIQALRARNVDGRLFVRRIGSPTEGDQRFASRVAASEVFFTNRKSESHRATANNHSRLLSAEESQLLLKINEGFPEEFWQRFQTLRHRLEEEAIIETERQEFLQMYDAVEDKNSERMGFLLQLAGLRGIPLPEMMQQLEIGPIQVE